MNFFERLWSIETQKWNLLLDYWFVYAVLMVVIVAFVVIREMSK